MFWWRLLIDPIRTLDLVDKDGKEDHGKIFPVVVIVCVIVAHFLGRPFSIGMAIALLSAAFGQSMFRAFLKARIVTAREEARFEYKHEVRELRGEPRNFEDGWQATD